MLRQKLKIGLLLTITLFSCESEEEAIVYEDDIVNSEIIPSITPEEIQNSISEKVVIGKAIHLNTDLKYWETTTSTHSYYIDPNDENKIYSVYTAQYSVSSELALYVNDGNFIIVYQAGGSANNNYIALPIHASSNVAVSGYRWNADTSSWMQHGTYKFTTKKILPKWEMLTVIVRDIDVTLGDGENFQVRMSDEEVNEFTEVANNITTTMNSWSKGQFKGTMDVIVVNDALTSMSVFGDGYWPSSSDTSSIISNNIAKKYSSITVCVDMGSIPTDGWGGLAYSSFFPMGSTYSVINWPDESTYIHEWLHGAGGWYRSLGFDVPDPHENADFGHPTETDGTWDFWYQDLMKGDITRDSIKIGYTPEVWLESGPNN